ncbi:CpsD/CapB family tyrosine-protein kinase [Aquibacillus albus]|uniref:non-specific protein-tyrosine kinase n=1 Tax=Aquibacillus albus TaxID=1168171 RepID=A0ABS2N5Z9_9BACI|nr:CpsD/CapB family tyrosine-protein kinase [Aquibacillus albus]MBM7573514.1 capsular exopolysaccharide synthesis family protein [Aquibacillus albus]
MLKRKQSSDGITTLIARSNPKSVIAEQYRTIRTNIQFASIDRNTKTIMVTSPGPGEGKTMTAANLAVVFAQQGKKVLIVDADMRKPALHLRFRKTNEQGLSNILAGNQTLQESVYETGMNQLDLLTCGPIPPNPSELLGSKAMEEFIEEAKENYDLVIFDTSPVLAVSDAQVLGGFCEGTILVLRSKFTEYRATQKTIDLLKSVNTKLLGTILNDREKKNSNFYYYAKKK